MEEEEEEKERRKSVRWPQESEAKVVAVEARMGPWGTRVRPDYVPKKDL